MEDLDYEKDDFRDIVGKDTRYSPRAYTLVMDVVTYLMSRGTGHTNAQAIMDEFRERTLDLFGPLSYYMLETWGVTCTEDIGEMMFNLADGHRIERDPDDLKEDFAAGYDFKETFQDPYA